MKLQDASEAIKKLYQNFDNSEKSWRLALKDFDIALEQENDAEILEACVLEDLNWELHVDGRFALLRKARLLGASSEKFLMDYFGYLAAHLDPGSEQDHASEQLERLLSESQA